MMNAATVVLDAPPMNEFIDRPCSVLISTHGLSRDGPCSSQANTEKINQISHRSIITLFLQTCEEVGRTDRKRYVTERELLHDRSGFLLDLISNEALKN